MFFRETSRCVRLLPMQGARLWVCVYCNLVQTLAACIPGEVCYLVSTMNCLSFLQPSTKPPTPDGVTKVNPFKFQLDSRMTSKQLGNSKNSDLVPVAEAIQKFQTATPPRFRSRKASDDLGGIQKSSSNTALTVPHTPNLVSRKRSRPVTVKSAAEIEEEEMAEMKE